MTIGLNRIHPQSNVASGLGYRRSHPHHEPYMYFGSYFLPSYKLSKVEYWGQIDWTSSAKLPRSVLSMKLFLYFHNSNVKKSLKQGSDVNVRCYLSKVDRVKKLQWQHVNHANSRVKIDDSRLQPVKYKIKNSHADLTIVDWNSKISSDQIVIYPFNLHSKNWFWGYHLRFFRVWNWQNIWTWSLISFIGEVNLDPLFYFWKDQWVCNPEKIGSKI